MGVRPLIDHKATLIDFDHEKQSSYQIHINHLQAFLEQYNPPPSNAEVCVSGPPSDPKKVCKFDIADLGTNCTWANKFGYADGQPCVLLKLNRIFDWVPESYANANDTGNPDAYESNSVLVTCNGEHPADIDNMGPVEFFPPAGFSFNYFPYKNQVGYRQPIVMAQFTGITRGIVVQIRCRAWADNILYHKNDKMGSVHFELRVD
ncbi:unnamed protein product [Owenia fusiformis]|uniref:Uncharacterized protein n=1 Tax=Owenia fusiformis TaxID=6347 RepID=A0A8J1UZP4_OWEFU|nr:unnamed protein product [Owenia fusiformis]